VRKAATSREISPRNILRQDLQDYQDFFGLVLHILSILLILSENRKFMTLCFLFDQTGFFLAGGGADT
jgi:hypothetical protein